MRAIRRKIAIEVAKEKGKRIRDRNRNTCANFQPSNQMLQKFVSETVYGGQVDIQAFDILDYFETIEKH